MGVPIKLTGAAVALQQLIEEHGLENFSVYIGGKDTSYGIVWVKGDARMVMSGIHTMIKDLSKKFKRTDYSNIEDCCYISDEKDIEMDYIKGEQNLLIHQALKALKAEYAQILYLIYFEVLSNAEAAKIMGKTSKQISDLIYCAKKALKAELERRRENGQV